MALAGRQTAASGACCSTSISAMSTVHVPRPCTLQSPCSPASSSCGSSNSSSGSSLLRQLSSSSMRLRQRHIAYAASSDMPGSSSNGGRPGGGSSGGGGRGRKSDWKARKPGLFEIKVVTPPPRSLGIYALPPNTHNGEEIEIEGQGYVVTRLELTFKLVKGRYVRDHSRLEVQPTSRYFLNMMLDNLIHGTYIGPADCGPQD